MEIGIENSEEPDPVDLVKSFVDDHCEIIEQARKAQATPSIESLENLSSQITGAFKRLETISETNFFRGTDNELAVSMAVSAVKIAVEELIEWTHEINADWKASYTFYEDAVENLTEELLGDEEKSAEATQQLCQLYGMFAQSLQGALIESEPIQGFIQRSERNRKRQENLMMFGGVMFAAFVGAKLAQKTNN